MHDPHDPHDPHEDLLSTARAWFALADDPRQQLSFFSEHPDLLSDECARLLEQLSQQKEMTPDDKQALTLGQRLLADIRRRDGTPEAISDAYVNRFSGYVLPLPPWILQGVVRIQRASQSGEDPAALAQRYRDLLRTARADPLIPSVTVGELYDRLGGELMRISHTTDRRPLQEEAIQAYKAALRLYPCDRFPDQHAASQVHLAVAYLHRIVGSKRKNIERALAFCKAALGRFTRTQDEQSLAETLNNLGLSYTERIAGNRQHNLTVARRAFERALTFFTPQRSVVEHARIQVNLGSAHEESRVGDPRQSIEQAITCFDVAIQLTTGLQGAAQEIWAAAHVNRGNDYRRRVAGDRDDNIETAIESYHQALTYYTRERNPSIWTIIQENLGLAYAERREGIVWRNREKAIVFQRRALRSAQRAHLVHDSARIQNNLGNAYLERLCGDRLANLEHAIRSYQAVLQILTAQTWPVKWAHAQTNLGLAYYEQFRLGQVEAKEAMITHFRAALGILTLDAFPVEYRQSSIRLARAYGYRNEWESAWRASQAALEAEDLLVQLGYGVAGRAVILAQETGAAELGGFALVQLGRLEEAITMIERGRARSLAEALALELASPARIRDPALRAKYQQARDTLIAAQDAVQGQWATKTPPDDPAQRAKELQAVADFAHAQEQFHLMAQNVKERENPPSFSPSPIDHALIQQVSERSGTGHAIVYLISSLWGGAAIAVIHHPHQGTTYHSLSFPHLTAAFLDRLLQTEIAGALPLMTGGYLHAQEGNAFTLLRQHQRHPSQLSFRELTHQFHRHCQGSLSTLDQAAQQVIAVADGASWLDTPLFQLSSSQFHRCFRLLDERFLAIELDDCLPSLAATVVRPLAEWLATHESVSTVTLIPCGRLAILPLGAAECALGQTFAERFPISYAPSLRALLSRETNDDPNDDPGECNDGRRHQRAGVYALGNPSPSHEEIWWGEMEARTLAALAGQTGYVRVQQDADRAWLLQGLREGAVVEMSTHAAFEIQNMLRSGLLLADGRWTLADMLNSATDARGVRLALLSGCQTAHLDIRGARDEVYSLAGGMLQAGAQATLAALWRVDDRATYLFMTHFAQEWFPQMKTEPPALALARTQRWMRTVTCGELQEWRIEGSGLSFEVHEAARQLRQEMSQLAEPQMRCFAAPYFWAGFHIMGW